MATKEKKFEGKRFDEKGELTREYRSFIGKRIYDERSIKGMNQKDFAKAVGISNQTYNNLENGKGSLKLEFLYQIAKYCGCDIGYLLGEIENRTYVATDICKATGLDVDAITALQSETISERHLMALEGSSDLKMELINFMILDLNSYNGLMSHILQIMYDKRTIEEYSKNKWFGKIKGIIDSIYKNNQNLKNPSKYWQGSFELDSVIMSGIGNALLEEGFSEKEIEEIEIETDFFFKTYQGYLTNAELIKARIQIVLTEYLNDYLFGGIEYGK